MNTLIIDAREAGVPSPTGKGLWTYHCIAELIQRKVPLILLTDRPFLRDWHDAPSVTVRYFPRGVRWHLAVWFFLYRQKAGMIYISPTSYILPAFIPHHICCFPVVHDLIAFQDEPHNRKAKFIERLLLGRCLCKAKGVFTISEATKRDIIERFSFVDEKRLVVVGAGPTVQAASNKRQAISGKQILCIGTLCPRKNQLRLLEAFSQIHTDAELVLAGGRGWYDAEIVRKAKEIPYVRWLGYVPDRELLQIFQESTMLAFPSLYEGFGFPVLDAMKLGIPVLTSERGSLKEVAGDAALFVDPEDVDSIRKGLEILLSQEDLRQDLREKGLQRAKDFSWERVIEKILNSL